LRRAFSIVCGAGIIGAHCDDDLAGAIDHDRRDCVAFGLAAVDRRLGDRSGHRIGEVAVGQQLRVRHRNYATQDTDQGKAKQQSPKHS
jgi:hypothetical protein